MEPEFLSQSAEPMTPGQQREWFSMQAFHASERGATFHRYSHHQEKPDLILYEGWKQRPEDQGDPRWQLVPLDC